VSVQQVQLELDSNVRRVSNGTALLGGSPFRVARLSAAGAALLDRWIAGDTELGSGQGAELHERLIRAGLVHPLPTACASLPTIAFVVPVYDDADGLHRLLDAVRRDHPNDPIIVIDDASSNRSAIAAIADRNGAQLLRHGINRGPAAARNTGWRTLESSAMSRTRPDVVVFVDADVVPQADAVRTMLGHFADPSVAAVAPRVQAEAGLDMFSAYEQHDSPLDMGTDAAIVFPGTRLSYVPSAMLAVRFDVLQDAGGLDEAMRYGEDVDMVWRMIHDGHLVRFEPRAVAHHRNRTSFESFARQRFTYGSSAASLAARHGDKVAPLQLPALTAASTVAMIFGRHYVRFAGLTAAVGSALSLARKLDGKVDESHQEALRLVATTHGYATQGLAAAATRSWAPLLLLTSRSRRALAAALIIPALVDWVRTRPANDPLTHTALRVVDHGSYCAGVWAGVVRSRSIAALLPRIRIRTRHDD